MRRTLLWKAFLALTASALVLGVAILWAETPSTHKVVLEKNQYHFSKPLTFETLTGDEGAASKPGRIEVWLQIGVATGRPVFVTIDTPVSKVGEVPKLMQSGEREWKALLSSSSLSSTQIVSCPGALMCCETDRENHCVKYKCACN